MFGLQFGDLIIIGIGIVILLVWLFLFLKGKKDADLFMPLNDEDYPLKDLYFVGYAFAELIHMNYQTERDTEMRKQLTVLYGSEYVDFYIRAVYAQRFTMAFTLACFAMPLYCLTIGSGLAFVMIIGVAGFAYYYYGKTLPDKIEKRKKEMIAEFSEVVSKLALMVNSGMILHDAWKTVAYSGTAEIYKEMQFSVEETANGKPEVEAIFGFGQRCMVPEIKNFATTLIQGITQGNAELAAVLKQQSKEVWTTRQQLVRREGELAANKLLLPMLIVFIGILIMVIVPIFAGIGA